MTELALWFLVFFQGLTVSLLCLVVSQQLRQRADFAQAMADVFQSWADQLEEQRRREAK